MLRILVPFVVLTVLSSVRWTDDPAARVKARFAADVQAFEAAVQALERSQGDTIQLKAVFRDARLAYKRIEWLVEGYHPSMARQLNGPPVDEAELEDQTLIRAEGFQVIEEKLFPAVEEGPELRDACRQLVQNTEMLRRQPWMNDIGDIHLWDALRLELLRIGMLGITGYDSPAAGLSLPEAIAALEGCREMSRAYTPAADTLFEQAISALRMTPFDRPAFLTRCLRPLCRLLANEQKRLGIPPLADTGRLFSTSSWWLFDEGVFRPQVLSPRPDWTATPQRIALGQRLFYEKSLSGNGSRSCATCHQRDKALTDGRVRSLALDNRSAIARNAPTLWNTALQSSFFYDGRAFSLETQIADVLQNPLEMAGSPDAAVASLAKQKSYRQAFAAAYPDGGLTRPHFLNALAAYLRSLVRLNARWDRYMRGEENALTLAEKRGFDLFAGKARCATCHFMPLTSGMLPPAYDHSDLEVLGVPGNADPDHPVPDPDRGAGLLGNFEVLQNAFKTVSLRNVEKTAPYMHNGVFATLEEVVDFYDRGGGAGIGLSVPNQTLPPERLNLTTREKADLVAFLKTLTDLPKHP
ncbi:cytochrome c peroxidase [Siphonobacter aquaeclarae]|uniref:Cytochrome c peroxidase n=1 Tax=Siphonobacter aquaeclarae TaxID=563176 RepID=A0A1G9NMF2_9BACT|nr:cytochrome c peroxidase [Siphonobacter aquaeclarae]SDL87570.1 cytochrome c peroxidase [Siphonobacter aquaeclarae]